MTSPERLAALYTQLSASQLPVLVLGGHAVKYYGIDRSTIDYDFHIALDPDAWSGLSDLLREALRVTELREAHSWRPSEFRRFAIGVLPDGRDELIDCWRRNHLLAPFPELLARSEQGRYGGALVGFLGLSDLIRSKETEREGDWRDILLLEEVADERHLAGAVDAGGRIHALRALRSRRSYEAAASRGLFSDTEAVETAAQTVESALAGAFRAAHLPARSLASAAGALASIGELLDGPLRRVTPGSSRHMALVEAVRRLYKQAAMMADRANKEDAAAEQP